MTSNAQELLAQLETKYAAEKAKLLKEITIRELVTASLGEGHEPHLVYAWSGYMGVKSGLGYAQSTYGTPRYEDFRKTLALLMEAYPAVETVHYNDGHYKPSVRPLAPIDPTVNPEHKTRPLVLRKVGGYFAKVDSGKTSYHWYAYVGTELCEFLIESNYRHLLGEFVARQTTALSSGPKYNCSARPNFGAETIKSQPLTDYPASYIVYFPEGNETEAWQVSDWVNLIAGPEKEKEAPAPVSRKKAKA